MHTALTEPQKEAALFIRSCIADRTDAADAQRSCGSDASGRSQTVKNFATLVKESDADEYKQQLHILQEYAAQYRSVVEQIDRAAASVTHLLNTYQEVATKTSSLHEACEQLMADQTQLAQTAEEIHNRLSYFQRADSLMHKLGSPKVSVTGENFLQLLNQIDECLAFLRAQPHYKESLLYVAKYQQCLSRALTHVRSHVKEQLRAAGEAVRSRVVASQRAARGTPPDDDVFTLYYGVFAANASQLRTLMENLHERLLRSHEYQLALAECQQFYLEQREHLMRASVQASLRALHERYAKNPCTLIRSACAFLLRVCEDETTLFYRFFAESDEQLSDFLEMLCSPLYDVARPIVVGIAHLESLAELCSILQQEMLQDRCGGEQTTESSGGFARVMRQLLGDVRERLLYRAHIFARTDIAGYSPAAGDLAYPEKLEMMRSIAEQTRDAGDSLATVLGPLRALSVSSDASQPSEPTIDGHTRPAVSPADLHGLWYPPVRRTVMCLSRLYKSLDPQVFQGVSQDLIVLCIQALQAANQLIKVDKGALDADLFLLKHLLILREQSVPFRVAVPIKETCLNMSRIKDAAVDLLRQRSRLFSVSNNAVLSFLIQMPMQAAEEQLVTSSRALDLELRRCCQKFIVECADWLQPKLRECVEQLQCLLDSHKGDERFQLKESCGAATPSSLQQLCQQSFRRLKEQWPLLVAKLSLYVANADTEHILLSHIRKTVQTLYSQLALIVDSGYSDDDRGIIGCPSAHQIGLLLAA